MSRNLENCQRVLPPPSTRTYRTCFQPPCGFVCLPRSALPRLPCCCMLRTGEWKVGASGLPNCVTALSAMLQRQDFTSWLHAYLNVHIWRTRTALEVARDRLGLFDFLTRACHLVRRAETLHVVYVDTFEPLLLLLGHGSLLPLVPERLEVPRFVLTPCAVRQLVIARVRVERCRFGRFILFDLRRRGNLHDASGGR